MKTYAITYSLLGSGYLEISAKSKDEAEEAIFNFTDAQLINNADFHKSLVIESIEIVKPTSQHSSWE